MFCKNCGASLPDGSVFCSACGQHVSNSSIEQQSEIQGERFVPTQQQPEYIPPSGYGVQAGNPIPPKRKSPWMIVLVSVLAVVAAAAIVFVCLKVFAAPKAEPDDFAKVYETLLQSASIGSQTVSAQATPVPTDAPTPTPAPAIIDLPGFEFVQLGYTSVGHAGKQFGSLEDFESALMSVTWTYQQSHANPEATSFNGGFVDVGDFDKMSLRAYNFNNDYTVALLELDPSDYSILYEDSDYYWTQQLASTFVACGKAGDQAEYDGVVYDVVLLLFIDTDGNLVESAALYDIDTETFIGISNYNVYIPASIPEPTVTSEYADHTGMEWVSQQEFEDVLMGYMWTCIGTDEQEMAAIIPDLQDITSDTLDTLVFYADETVYGIALDNNTLEVVNEATLGYFMGDMYTTIYIGEYEYDGVIYEADYYYYIDYNGYLVECVVLYDYDLEEYYIVSNANIYEPTSP